MSIAFDLDIRYKKGKFFYKSDLLYWAVVTQTISFKLYNLLQKKLTVIVYTFYNNIFLLFAYNKL